MRLKIRCDRWKRKYFGFAWEVNMAILSKVSLRYYSRYGLYGVHTMGGQR
jgi:hypothetical protein